MKEVVVIKENNRGAIKDSGDLFKRIKKIDIDYGQENFIIFLLDTKNKLIQAKVLFKGGLNMCIIDPKTVFRQAVKHNANSIILAHNHPSGDLEPSEEDIDIHKRMCNAGDMLSLKCLDSIIFSKKAFYSMINDR